MQKWCLVAVYVLDPMYVQYSKNRTTKLKKRNQNLHETCRADVNGGRLGFWGQSLIRRDRCDSLTPQVAFATSVFNSWKVLEDALTLFNPLKNIPHDNCLTSRTLNLDLEVLMYLSTTAR